MVYILSNISYVIDLIICLFLIKNISMDFIKELKWRGMIHDIMPGTESQFAKEMTAAYIGFDPTADSLHIGSLVQIMTLVHLQKCGHKPIALVGGATGMVGDPSGKSKERNLLDEKELNKNITAIQKKIEEDLGLKVMISNKKNNSGKVTIEYKNLEQFDLISRLLKQN